MRDDHAQTDEIPSGIHVWDNWEEVVVAADVRTVAARLAELIGGVVQWDAYDQPLWPGDVIVAKPRHLRWSNILPVTSLDASFDWSEERVAELAAACHTSALIATYNDTAGTAYWKRFEPDGSTTEDIGLDIDYLETSLQLAEMNDEPPPEKVLARIAELNASGQALTSTARLEAIAKAEGFAMSWEFFHCPHDEDSPLRIRHSRTAFESVAQIK